jgi:competence protein ComEC
MFGISCGAGAVGAQDLSPEIAEAAAGVPACRVEGTVLESLGGLGSALAADLLECEGRRPLVDAGVVVADLAAHAGAGFVASGWLIPLGEDPFDRARARAGAGAELAIEDIELSPPNGIAAVAAGVREGLVEAGTDADPAAAGLLRGLTIGDTEGITRQTLEEFRRAGLSHLLAVSGSNVSIVLGAVLLLGGRLPFRSRLALGGVALAFYVLVVGPEASVLRAAAMGAAGIAALATGRRSEPMHALAVAVAVVVAIRPQIIFSVGLHLSVLATAGIILLAPLVMRMLWWMPKIVSLPLAVTIGAQAAVVPLLVIVFGEMSVVAPASNLLAAPAVAPATILGLAAGLIAPVHTGAGALVVRLAEPFAAWILFVGRVSSEPVWANLEVPSTAGWLMLVPVMMAFWFALHRQSRGLLWRA